MNGNRVLVIFRTKQVESGSELLKLGIYSMNFYKVWHSSQPLLSQTMANRILGCLPTISYRGRVPFLCYNGLTSSLQN
jgi:hypothetical protein